MPKIVLDAKNKILLNAKKQLFSCGYHAMTLRSVASECAIAVGTIYNYFSSKDMLVASIMAEDWKKSLQTMHKRCEEATSVHEGIGTMYDEIFRFSKLYEPVWNDYMASGKTPIQYGERHMVLRGHIAHIVKNLITRFKRQEDSDLVPIISEMILTAAVQKDIEYEQLATIIDRIFPKE